jgi:DNA repair photolyase
MLPKIYRKSLLYKSGVEYADFSLNHVEGCSHGCLYPCYAMMMKKRCGIIKNYQNWIKPKLVANALELLDMEIPRYKNKIKFVHLCFSTDPFMYRQSEVIDLTLKIIAKLNNNGIRCTVLTKGLYPRELLQKKYSKDNEYGITLVSLDENYHQKLEPYSAPFNKRIEGLKMLSNMGLKTWVSMEPYPTPNFISQDIKDLIKNITFVNKIVFGRLNYNKLVSNYKDAKKFYKDSADIVSSFCTASGIEYHIKFKTTTDLNSHKTNDKQAKFPLEVPLFYSA